MTRQQFEEQTEASLASENKKEVGAGIDGGFKLRWELQTSGGDGLLLRSSGRLVKD